MALMTFREWLAMREGLWLADKNAIPGMSRINPFPTTQARLKQMRPKPIKPVKPIKPTINKIGTVPVIKPPKQKPPFATS